MFSTICLLFFGSFFCWMNTSKRIAWVDRPAFLQTLHGHVLPSRYLAAGLCLLGTILSVALLGVGSGLFSAVVLMMMAGSLSVVFFPFRYFGVREILTIYLVGVCLELIF